MTTKSSGSTEVSSVASGSCATPLPERHHVAWIVALSAFSVKPPVISNGLVHRQPLLIRNIPPRRLHLPHSHTLAAPPPPQSSRPAAGGSRALQTSVSSCPLPARKMPGAAHWLLLVSPGHGQRLMHRQPLLIGIAARDSLPRRSRGHVLRLHHQNVIGQHCRLVRPLRIGHALVGEVTLISPFSPFSEHPPAVPGLLHRCKPFSYKYRPGVFTSTHIHSLPSATTIVSSGSRRLSGLPTSVSSCPLPARGARLRARLSPSAPAMASALCTSVVSPSLSILAGILYLAARVEPACCGSTTKMSSGSAPPPAPAPASRPRPR